MDSHPSDSPPGLDLAALRAYLDQHAPGVLEGALSAQVIAGGKSNLTYRVSAPGGDLVLRRPPLGHVLPTAHDMGREFTVIAALHPTGFPVPAPVHLCRDPEVIGAPFYLMSFVDGVVLRDETSVHRLSPAAAARASELLVDTLADLHAIDPSAVGLGDFGRPEGYLQRQVRRWYQQWEASKTRELPLMERAAGALRDTVPAGTATGIVHGDYRLDNCLYGHDLNQILAVLDWEMATLGDPLADLGLLVVYTELAAAGLAPTGLRIGPEQGFLSGAGLIARYTERAARPGLNAPAAGPGLNALAAGPGLDRIGWYVALGYYKLAIISEGIHARYLMGKTVGPGFDQLGERVPELVDRALAALAS